MKKKWFFKSFISFALPIFLVLLTIGSLAIYFVHDIVLKELNKNNENLLIQIRTNVETILTEVNSLSLNFEYYTKTSQYTDYVDTSTYTPEKRMVEDEMLNFINTLANSRMYIHSIYVYINNVEESFIVSNEGKVKPNQFLDNEWLLDAKVLEQSKNMLMLKPRSIKRFSFETPTKVITAYRKLYMGLKHVGTVALNINTSYLDERLSKLNLLSGQEVSISSQGGDEFYYFFYGEADHNGRDEKITVVSSDKGYSYVSKVPMNQLYEFSYRISLTFGFIFLICIFTIMIASYIMTKRNYDRIVGIYSVIEAANGSCPLPDLPSKVKDEYGYIIQNMIRVFIESRFVKAQLNEKKSKYEAMELLALQSQINPHFLFNTLETINWGIVKHLGITNHVSKMLGNLSNVLKYSLSNPNEKVTLGEEIVYTKSYVAIQQERYQDKFEMIWDIDESLEDYYIIKLIIQPLIENAIYHGIKEKEGKSKIKVILKCEGDFICLEIIDTGKGMTKDKLEQLRTTLDMEPSKSHSTHIGVKNVYKRLRLVYDDRCIIHIKSKEGWGTHIIIYLPMDNTKEIESFTGDF